MKKAVLFLVAFFVCAGALFAVPAGKEPITFQQADGTSITVYRRGDENTKWYESLDGYSLLRVEKQFYYAVKDKEGNMVASQVKAHNQDQRTRQEKKLLRKTPKQLHFSAEQLKNMRAKGPVALANSPARILNNSPLAKSFKARKNLTDTISRRAPVILINFADKRMTTTKEQYDALVNTRNYTENGCTGSFRDYFLDNSRGLFLFEADVIGPITLSRNMAYYGGNDLYGDDSHPQEMAVEACRIAAQNGVDFSRYDFDGDGYVDGVHIIFPGQGEEVSEDDDAIWSHMWNVDETVVLNGTQLDVYSCSGEFSQYNEWDYIGTLVHEMSHVFGLPDLYDSDYGESGGNAVDPEEFDVMAYGSYNEKGKVPPLHNAWSRMQMGWLDAMELKDPCTVRLYPAEEATHAVMYSTAVDGEYFVLDYRGEESKWDVGIPGYGMLIFALNENVEMVDYPGYSAWDYNCVNCNPQNRGLYIKQANGGAGSNAAMGPGTPFPGRTNAQSFTDNTEPSARSHSGKNTNKPISQITELPEGGVSFVFIEKSDKEIDNVGGRETGRVADPVFEPAPGSVVDSGSLITISCATAKARIYYTVNGTEPSTASTLYTDPVEIKENTVFKAMAVKEGLEGSKVVTASYTVRKPGVGTESHMLKGVKVYPNPNEGRFIVELPEKAEVSVFGMNGTLLKQQSLQEGRHELRLPEAGTYVLHVQTAKAATYQKVMVR